MRLPQEDEVMGEKQGRKVYPEVDAAEFPGEYMLHVNAMTEEDLFGKGEIAAQLAWRDVQLAAKDREIAELQRQLETWRAAEHAAISKGEAIKGERDEALTKYEAAVSKYDAAVEKSITLMQERDEARECVGRLYKALNAFNDIADYDCKGNSLQCAARDEFEGMWAALAATPEGLR
jgi:hypothetical protein